MWQVNCSYKRDNTDTKFPLCKKSEDTTEHVLEYEKANRLTLSKENNKGGKQQQGKITTKEGRKEGNHDIEVCMIYLYWGNILKRPK